MVISLRSFHLRSNELNSPHAWIVVLTSSLFFFYIFFQMNLFNAINADLVKEFNLTANQLSHMFAVYSYGNVALLFASGVLLDRLSVRKTLLTAFAISIIATYVFSTASSIEVMFISRFTLGVTGAFAFLPAIKLASRWFETRYLAMIVGAVVTVGMLGGTVAQAPLAILTQSLGWRAAVQVAVAFGLVLMLVQLIIVRDEPRGQAKLEILEHKQLEKIGFWRSLAVAISNSQNWFSGIYISLVNLPVFIFGGIWGVPYLTQVHNLTMVQATIVTGMIFIGMMVGSPLAGIVSDRVGLRKFPMIVGGILVLLVLLAVMFIPTSAFLVHISLYFILGLVCGSQVIGYPVIAESNPHTITATATSLSSVLVLSGGFLVPIFGWLLSLSNDAAIVDGASVYSHADFTRANCLMLVGLVIAIISAILIRETRCKQLQIKQL